ncbi:MAG TPA: leucine-rich repeat domain-containing protein [Candidatus Saccharimonadales bacterium]|nr:leucine-rich repeat domain-containing protein [Candidatus Saccharimonadales bacterium]
MTNRQVYLNDDVLREILSHADIQSVFRLYQVNKTLYHQHDDLFKQIYRRLYGQTGMDVFKKDMTWFQLLKLCYQLSRLLLLLPSLKKYTMKALYTMTQLDLSYSKIKVLPPEIGQLSALRYLHLSNNQLSALPPEIGKLSHLQILDLSNNQLIALPPEIGKLSTLQCLSLSNNQLSALLPEMGQMSHLHELYLRDNQLRELPPEIGQLSHLKYMNLSHNKLSALPPEMSPMNTLQCLNLSNNRFSLIFKNELKRQLPYTEIVL